MSDEHAATPPTPETELATDAPAPQAVPQISLQTWNDVVGRWIADHVRSSVIAQHSGAWNRLNEVLPKLHALLNSELAKKE